MERVRPGAAAVLVLLSLVGCAAPATDDSPPATEPAGSAAAPAAPAGSAAAPGIPAAAPALPTAAPTSRERRRITVAATGEILIHPSVWRDAGPALDFRPLLAGARGRVATVDLAVCHLETTLAPSGGPYRGYPSFATPPDVVAGIASAGFDTCSNASNHSLDQGVAGITRTLDALDAAGIGHAGLARTAREATAAATTLRPVGDVAVAHLSYSRDLNGNIPPPGRAWSVSRLVPTRVLADARRARAAGADLVIVSLHHGTEYQTEPDAGQRSAVRLIAASPDVDLVLGHHAHVVQPVTRVGTTWVAWGLGNLVSGQSGSDPRRREGVVMVWRFTERDDGRFVADRATAYPTLNRSGPTRVVDVVSALRAAPGDARLAEAYRRVRTTVLAEGAAAAGMVVPAP